MLRSRSEEALLPRAMSMPFLELAHAFSGPAVCF